MLELSHEANFTMNVVSNIMNEIFEATQSAANKYARKIAEIHQTNSTALKPSLFGSTSNAPAVEASDGFPSKRSGDSSESVAALLDDIQGTIRGLQKRVLQMTTTYETFLTALHQDVKKKTTGVAPILMPSTRTIPHPSVATPYANPSVTTANTVSLPLISSPAGADKSSARFGAPPANNNVVVPKAPSAMGAAPSPRKEQSATLGTSGNVAQGAQSTSLVDRSHETVAASFYFSFDAVARSLRAREAVAYIQKSPDEAQAVCVFGGKPRHPSTVSINLRSGVVGSVIKSGIAVNVAMDEPTAVNSHMLCFPILARGDMSQPIGAVVVEKHEGPAFNERDAALVHLWTVLAAQFLSGYGVDIVGEPFDPFQSVFRPNTKVSEFLFKTKHNRGSALAGAPTKGNIAELTEPTNEALVLLGIPGFEKLLTGESAASPSATKSFSASKDQVINMSAVAALFTSAQYSTKLAAIIAAQIPPQLVFLTSHRSHGLNFRPSEFKGHAEILRYQNVMDVATYIRKLDDSWRRSTDDLQGMEVEQISQMQDMKHRKRKLKQVAQQLETTEKEAKEYRDKYDVLKKEIASLAYE